MAGRRRLVRVVHRLRDVLGVHPALEGAVQHRVAQRQCEVPVRDRQLPGGAGAARGAARVGGERHRADHGVRLLAPGAADGAGGREVRGLPERLRAALRGAALLGCDAEQRVVETECDGDEAVHAHQVGEHPGDGRLAADPVVALVPAKPYGRVPLGVADVLEQGVEAGGLRVVRSGPLGDRDAGRTPGQAAFEDAGAQHRVEVEALLGVQQAHGVPQPQRLLGARAAAAEVHLHGDALLGRARGQRPRAEEGLEDAVLQDERLGDVVRQRAPGVLHGRARRRYPGARGGVGTAGALGLPGAVTVVGVVGLFGVAEGVGPAHSALPCPGDPGGVPEAPLSCAVDRSWRPRRRRRRASSSVTPRSTAVWR